MPQQRPAQTAPSSYPSEMDVEINFSELLYRLLEKWKVIALCAILGLVLSAGYTFQLVTPMYEATAKIYVMNSKDSAINLSDLQIGSYLTSDYQEVFKTWVVHEMVIQNLGLAYSYQEMQGMLSITNPADTRILYITVTLDDAARATQIANEYAKVAKKYISETMATEEPSIMADALQPTKPVKPNKTMNLMMGLVLGAVLAIAVVVIRFLLDDKLKTTDDVQKYAGMSTLAVVPVYKKPKETPKKSEELGGG